MLRELYRDASDPNFLKGQDSLRIQQLWSHIGKLPEEGCKELIQVRSTIISVSCRKKYHSILLIQGVTRFGQLSIDKSYVRSCQNP